MVETNSGMREILFKAKTKMIVSSYNCGKEDGEWVKGYLYNDVGRWIIRQFEHERADYVGYEVDPETICQLTGKTDKNGTKIWENDIICGLFSFGTPVNARVVFRDGAFGLLWCRGDIAEFSAFTSICNVEYEVLGNVFDDPQLFSQP